MPTHMISIKSETNIPEALKPFITFQVTDGNVEAVVLKMGDDFIRIVKGSDYGTSLKVLSKEPKKIVSKWAVQGTFMGLTEVAEVFDDEYKANTRKSEFQSAAGYGDTGLEVVEIQVEEDETKI